MQSTQLIGQLIDQSKSQSVNQLMFSTAKCDFQELLRLDLAAAEDALRHFQSCVRTTLLLCNGYECQEKVQSTTIFTATIAVAEMVILFRLILGSAMQYS